ncbi:MAG: DUF2470 domain-containing protein [Streptosporangiales bacterium]|nr:DUF2470 domain-containing protein [Streptosporangiales bacterium]
MTCRDHDLTATSGVEPLNPAHRARLTRDSGLGKAYLSDLSRGGEPMRQDQRPSPAERARTMAYGIAPALLSVAQVGSSEVTAHATDSHGRPVLLVPDRGLLDGFDGTSAVLTLTDLSPIPQADRVRGRAWLDGWLTVVPEHERNQAACLVADLHPRPELLELGTGWTLLRLDVCFGQVHDIWGCAYVEPEDYLASAPDPFVDVEHDLLTHLDTHHPDEIVGLCTRLGERTRAWALTARLIGISRHGLWIRLGGRGSRFDLHLQFPTPVSDLDELQRAFRHLVAGHLDGTARYVR